MSASGGGSRHGAAVYYAQHGGSGQRSGAVGCERDSRLRAARRGRQMARRGSILWADGGRHGAAGCCGRHSGDGSQHAMPAHLGQPAGATVGGRKTRCSSRQLACCRCRAARQSINMSQLRVAIHGLLPSTQRSGRVVRAHHMSELDLSTSGNTGARQRHVAVSF